MNSYRFTIAGVIVALAAWFFDAGVHVVLFGEPFEFIPHDGHELWMRTTAIVLFILFGVGVDYIVRLKERENERRLEIYKSSMVAAQHILNNFLNNAVLFHMEAGKCEQLDKELLSEFQNRIYDSARRLQELGHLKPKTGQEIRDAVAPNRRGGEVGVET